jgi:hypothetical protein
MNDLLKLAIETHGGLEKWNSFKSLEAHLHVTGKVWAIKGKPDVFRDVHYHADLHKQLTGFDHFPIKDQFTTFRPDRVSIETYGGEIIEESIHPRESFAGHEWATPWNLLQMLYFSNYAFWTYMTAPFNFTLSGYETRELEPWKEGPEIWRRLEVTFPDRIATHNKVQIFYYDEKGFQRRHDYAPDIMNHFISTQIVSDYREYDGIKLPTKRIIYIRNPNDSFQTDPELVHVEVESVKFK